MRAGKTALRNSDGRPDEPDRGQVSMLSPAPKCVSRIVKPDEKKPMTPVRDRASEPAGSVFPVAWFLGAAVFLLPLTSGCSRGEAQKASPVAQESGSLGRVRQLFARIAPTLERNHKTFEGRDGQVSGFGAGDAYPQIWLRDSAWIVDAAAAGFAGETLTSWLDLHLAHAAKGGRLRDWVAKGPAESFREWAPRVEERDGISFDTNSNESDQEPSAALALCRTERILGPPPEEEKAAYQRRRIQVIAAMEALLRDRTDPGSGLIWSGLTADWGDVSPVYGDQRSIYRDQETPRTLSLYSNVMVFAALDCLSNLENAGSGEASLAAHAARFGERIRSVFWMKNRGFFRIRVALDAEPAGFSDDDERFALGGNALAALFGAADDAQAESIFKVAERLREGHGYSTISTTLVPPYASGVFKHPAMREPFQYQNGGQWDWFGATLVEAEFERGFSEQARAHLDQIASRILAAGPGIHEWYGQDGSAKGSPAYAAAAATLYNAIAKGLLGVSNSARGYEVVVRTEESLRPFVLERKASGDRLVISQSFTHDAVEVRIESSAPVALVCSQVPNPRVPTEAAAVDSPMPQEIRRIGADTLMCADTSQAPQPGLRVRFALSPAQI